MEKNEGFRLISGGRLGGLPQHLFLVAFCVLLTACFGNLSGQDVKPVSTVSVPTASVTVLPLQEASTCTPNRQRELVMRFFDAYNRRDEKGFFALFGVERHPVQYFDNIEGQSPVDIRGDRAALAGHLRSRFQGGDWFAVDSIEVAQNMAPGMTNPTVAFSRTWAEGRYRGNAKLVCRAGYLESVVMTSSRTTNWHPLRRWPGDPILEARNCGASALW